MPDDPAALLSPIRERSGAALEFPLSGFAEDSIRACTQSAMDVPRLLAAVEAALKLAGKWDAERLRLDTEAYEICARALRAAITTALVGLDEWV